MNSKLTEESLTYLFEAARLGTMRAAAEKLNVAASSVSRQISKLESEVGHTLYEKRRHKFQLTEVGEILCDFYRRRMIDYEKLLLSLDQIGALQRGSIDIALSEGFIASLISPTISAFSKRHRDIHIKCSTLPTTQEVVDTVLQDTVHVGLVFDPPSHPHLRILRIIPQPLCAITLPSDPIAQKDSCSLRDLCSSNILLNQDYMLFDIIQRAADTENVQLKITITANSLSLLTACIRDQAGISILSKLSVAEYLKGGMLAATPIDNALFQSSVATIITRLGRQFPKAVNIFVRELETAVAAILRDLKTIRGPDQCR
jgi:DNA-binding transcriptional LysR family regulator